MPLKPRAARLFVLVSAPLLGTIHLFAYSWAVGLYLYQLMGGMARHGGWTEYGGIRFAWAIPLQLPGTLLLSWDKLGPSAGIVAIALVLAASVGVGYSAASLTADFIGGQRRPRQYLDWRLMVIVPGIIWIPVPETLAFVYYYTVKYRERLGVARRTSRSPASSSRRFSLHRLLGICLTPQIAVARAVSMSKLSCGR
jgi:hypothetical protein